VHEARAAGVPILRPSIIPSLVRVRAHNADQGVEDLRLFELGSVFHRSADGSDHEALELGLLMDSCDQVDSIRPLRGVIDHLAAVLAGMDAVVKVAPCDDLLWLSPAGRITINGNDVGVMGCLRAQPSLGDRRLLAAAIRPADLMQHQPAERAATRLPDHPAIERDISAIVLNDITWAEIERIVNAAELPHHEATTFVTAWRGKGVPDGHKSVTMRLRFRAQDRTLLREEVEESMVALLDSLRSGVNAEIRS
jgi:phenylalanyl-tRNA synthetase beta chain